MTYGRTESVLQTYNRLVTAHAGLLRAIRACVSISLIARTLKHEQENEKDAFLSE